MSKKDKNILRNQLSEEHWKVIPEVINSIFAGEGKNEGNEQYWHYTSVNGVLGIFDEYIKGFYNSMDDDAKRVKNCSVYASNIRFMNDSKEYEEGNNLYRVDLGESGSHQHLSAIGQDALYATRESVEDTRAFPIVQTKAVANRLRNPAHR